jgi:hypothetical protein
MILQNILWNSNKQFEKAGEKIDKAFHEKP